MKKQREHYAPEEKVATLRRHLLEKKPPRLLAGGLGEAGHHRLSSEEPMVGYRRLTFLMLDADIVAVSPTSYGAC